MRERLVRELVQLADELRSSRERLRMLMESASLLDETLVQASEPESEPESEPGPGSPKGESEAQPARKLQSVK